MCTRGPWRAETLRSLCCAPCADLCCAPCADLCCAPCALPLCAPCAPCARALCRVWCALAAHLPLRAPASLSEPGSAPLSLSLHLSTQAHSLVFGRLHLGGTSRCGRPTSLARCLTHMPLSPREDSLASETIHHCATPQLDTYGYVSHPMWARTVQHDCSQA